MRVRAMLNPVFKRLFGPPGSGHPGGVRGTRVRRCWVAPGDRSGRVVRSVELGERLVHRQLTALHGFEQAQATL